MTHFALQLHQQSEHSSSVCDECFQKLTEARDFLIEIKAAQEMIASMVDDELEDKSEEGELESKGAALHEAQQQHLKTKLNVELTNKPNNEQKPPKNLNLEVPKYESNEIEFEIEEVKLENESECEEDETLNVTDPEIVINEIEMEDAMPGGLEELKEEQEEDEEIQAVDIESIEESEMVEIEGAEEYHFDEDDEEELDNGTDEDLESTTDTAKQPPPLTKIERKSSIKANRKRALTSNDYQRIDAFFSFDCDICGDNTINRYLDYKEHMERVHHSKKPAVYCCKRKLTSGYFLIDHVNYHQNPDVLKCKKCGKQFRESYRLKYHLEYHDDPFEGRNFECDVCTKRFYTMSALKTHLVSHLTPEEKEKLKTYVCAECGKAFEKQAYLNHHVRLYHEAYYKSVCNLCSRTFKSQHELNDHIKFHHTDPEALKRDCPICGVTLSNERNLKNHIRRIHENVGPHECPTCGKLSPTRTALREHISFVHKKTRAFVCEVCNQSFKRQISLLEHMSLHTGVALYQCTFCDKTFNANSNLYSHRKKAHPEELKQMNLSKNKKRSIKRSAK